MVQVVVDGQNADLAKLFIAPQVLRAGVGGTLFDWRQAIEKPLGTSEVYRG